MTEFRFVTDPASLHSSGTGPVSGKLWLEMDSVAFPEADWDDFVIVILAAWADALLQLQSGLASRAHVHFMEGPYEVELLGPRGGLVGVHARESEAKPCLTGNVPFSQLSGSVVSASFSMLDACRELGLWSADADSLANRLPGLRSSSN